MRAARWLGLGQPRPRHHNVVAGDRMDEHTWSQTRDEAPALTALEQQISQTHTHAADLLQDLFLLAYKVQPRLRDTDEIEVSRLPNRAVVSTIAATPEFQTLRRHTVGDRYAAAMAVLAQAQALQQQPDDDDAAQQAAQDAEQHNQQADAAAQAVAAALDAATKGCGEDDPVQDAAVDALDQAIQHADTAAQQAADAVAAAQKAAEDAAAARRARLRAGAQQAAGAAADDQALMAAWNITPERLRGMSFDERTALAQQLRSGRLGEFADLIGRFRLMAAGKSARRSVHGQDEVVGVTLGDDLSRLLPAELAAVGVPALRAVFAARFAEQQLMMYETTGEQPEGRGAIIALIDCSSSMTAQHSGPAGRSVTREAWAKACGLALLDQARRQHRDFVAILFSNAEDIDVFRFPAAEEPLLERVLEFADSFAGNLTDFQTPLDRAADILADQYNRDGTARGDIVLITDGEAGVDDDWLTQWRERKARLAFRVFGIAIRTSRTTTLTTLADHLTVVDDLAPAAAENLFTLV